MYIYLIPDTKSNFNFNFMKWRYFLYSLFALCLVFLTACEKDPGEGGTATITGKILVLDFDDGTGEFKREYFAQDRQVYIIYGEGSIQDDDVRTGFDGTYEFNYLHKGRYIIYAYSECPEDPILCPSGEEPILDTIEITQKGETYEIPTIQVIE